MFIYKTIKVTLCWGKEVDYSDDLRVELHVPRNGNVLVAGKDLFDAALQVRPDLLEVDLFQAGRVTVVAHRVRVPAIATATTASLHPERCAAGGCVESVCHDALSFLPLLLFPCSTWSLPDH